MAGLKLKIDATQAENASKQLRRDLKRLGAESVLTEKEIKQLETRMRKGMASREAKQALDRVRSSTRMTRREFAQFEKRIAGSAATWQKFSRVSRRVVGGLLSIKGAIAGMGIGFLIADIAKTGAQFEQTMAEVKGITGATAAEFKALESIAREMGETTEWTAKQSADALKFMSMAGFEAKEAIGALPGVLDLATAGHIDLGRAADIATNALTAFRLDVEDLSRVNDVMIRTITTSNTNMHLMAESFKYSASVAAGFGYEIEQLSTYIGLLGNAGIQGSMAGTQLAMVMQQANEVFSYYGESVKDATGETKDLLDALKLLEERGASTTEVLDIFTARSGRAVLAFLGMGTDVVERYMHVVQGAEGASKTLAEIMRGTTIGAFKELNSAIEGVKIDIFSDNSGELNQILKDMTRYVRDNKDELVDLGNTVADVTMSIGKMVAKMGELVQMGLGPFTKIGKAIALIRQTDASFGQIGSIASGEELDRQFKAAHENRYLYNLRKRLQQKQMELADWTDPNRDRDLASYVPGTSEYEEEQKKEKKLLAEIRGLQTAISEEMERQAAVKERERKEKERIDEADELRKEIQNRKKNIEALQKEAEFRKIAAKSNEEAVAAEIKLIEQKYEKERILAEGNASLIEAINAAEQAELADLYEQQRQNRVREYEKAYKVTGDMTREHYALMRGQIESEKQAFIEATGDKVVAAEKAAAKMGELNAKYFGQGTNTTDRWLFEAETASDRKGFSSELVKNKQQRKAQAQKAFAEEYQKQVLGTFQYERAQLKKQADIWKQAGVNKLEVNQWLHEELKRLAKEQTEYESKQYMERLEKGETWAEGTELFLKRFERDQKSTAEKVAGIWESTFSAMGNAFSSLFSDFVAGEMKSLADYAQAFAMSIAQSLGQEAGDSLMGLLGEGIEGLLGSWGTSTNAAGSAAGMFKPSSAVGMADGGWINEPIFGRGLRTGTNYAFGEQGPERVTPADQVGGHVFNTTINVAVNDSGQGRGDDEEDNEELGRNVARMVEAEFDSYLRKQLRPGGMLNQSIG